MDREVGSILNKIGLIFASIVVIPTLGGLALGFGIAMVAIPLAAILQVSGLAYAIMDNLNFYIPFGFNFGPWILPDYLVVPVAFGFTVLFFIITKKVWVALKNYIKYVKVGLVNA